MGDCPGRVISYWSSKEPLTCNGSLTSRISEVSGVPTSVLMPANIPTLMRGLAGDTRRGRSFSVLVDRCISSRLTCSKESSGPINPGCCGVPLTAPTEPETVSLMGSVPARLLIIATPPRTARHLLALLEEVELPVDPAG